MADEEDYIEPDLTRSHAGKRRGGKGKRAPQFKARRFPSPQRAGHSPSTAGAPASPSFTNPSSSGGNPSASFLAGSGHGGGGSTAVMGSPTSSAPAGGQPFPSTAGAPTALHGFVTLHKSPTSKDATAGFPTLVSRASFDAKAREAAGTHPPLSHKGGSGSTGGALGSRLRSKESVSDGSFSNVSPTSNSTGGFPTLHRGNSLSQVLGWGAGSPTSSRAHVTSPGGSPSTAEQRVSVFFPRKSSEVEVARPEGLGGGAEDAEGVANDDLMQVRVEGYFDNDTGVLIPSDLPKSTFLYVLTASDGRDLMFKTVQYSLQLLICILKTPSLFSPESAPLLDFWAVRLWKNYNTIRHGRSLFKMGRGFLNLFTLQTVCERMWMRYGGAVTERCAPVLAVMGALVEPVRALGEALGVPGCARRPRTLRLKRFPGETGGPASDDDEEEGASPDDGTEGSPKATPTGSKTSTPVTYSEAVSTDSVTAWPGLRSYLSFFPFVSSGGGRGASHETHGDKTARAAGLGQHRHSGRSGHRSSSNKAASGSVTGGPDPSSAHRSKRGGTNLVTDDTYVHVSRVERVPGYNISPTQRVPAAAAAAGAAAAARLGSPTDMQPPPQPAGARSGGVSPAAEGLSGATPSSAMPFYVKGEFGTGSFAASHGSPNTSFAARFGASPPSTLPAGPLLTGSGASNDFLMSVGPGEASHMGNPLDGDGHGSVKCGSTYAGSAFEIRSLVQRQMAEQRRHAQSGQQLPEERNIAGEEATRAFGAGNAATGTGSSSTDPFAEATHDGVPTRKTSSVVYEDHFTSPPTPMSVRKPTFGPTAPPSPSLMAADAKHHGPHGTRHHHHHHHHHLNDSTLDASAYLTADGTVAAMRNANSSMDDDQGPPTLPETLPQGDLSTVPHIFSHATQPRDEGGADASPEAKGDSADTNSEPRDAPSDENNHNGNTNALGAKRPSGGSLLHPLRETVKEGTKEPSSPYLGLASAGRKSTKGKAAERDFFATSPASSLPEAASAFPRVSLTPDTPMTLPGARPPLVINKSPMPSASSAPDTAAPRDTTPLTDGSLAGRQVSGVFPASFNVIGHAGADAADTSGCEYFTSAKSVPFEENLGAQLRRQEAAERRRSKHLDTPLGNSRRSHRKSGTASMNSSQNEHRAARGTAPDSLGSSCNPEPAATLWNGIGNAPSDEAAAGGAQALTGASSAELPPPPPLQDTDITHAFYSRYCDDEVPVGDNDGAGPLPRGQSATAAPSAAASKTNDPRDNGNKEGVTEGATSQIELPPPEQQQQRKVGDRPVQPRLPYDDSDVSLDNSSADSDYDEEEGTGPLTASHPHTLHSHGVMADSDAFAYHNDELEPASAALPSRWRRSPLDFDPVLMTMVGLRNLAAAIRRFLRDLTLLSSERFFILDFVERNRTSIHRRINYLWLIVSVIDLSLNTIRLSKHGWVAYAMARQNTLCRCGCKGRDDPDDLVWRSNGLIARQKKDLVFPPLDLDYGAPYTSNKTYVEAADPIHLQPSCSRCGCLYKEVVNYTNVHAPEDEKPRWLQVYDAEVSRSPELAHRLRQSQLPPTHTGNPFLLPPRAMAPSPHSQQQQQQQQQEASEPADVVPVEVKTTIAPASLTVERSVVRVEASHTADGAMGAEMPAMPHSRGGLPEASAAAGVHDALTREVVGYVPHGHPSLGPSKPTAGSSPTTATSGTKDSDGYKRNGLLLPPARRTPDPESSLGFLLLPYLMRRLFNYIWLLRVHPNLTSTLLLQLRYMAELFLAYKYCFGNYEPNKTDAPLYQILNPGGAIAGIVSAAVGLLRVVESAPK